jgi:hypothetical protein
MLGEPVPPEAQALGVAREIDGATERFAGIDVGGHGSEIEDGQRWYHALYDTDRRRSAAVRSTPRLPLRAKAERSATKSVWIVRSKNVPLSGD